MPASIGKEHIGEMNRMKYGKKRCIAVWIAMLSILCLCGCGDKTKKLQPQEWIMNGQIVSYYDNGEDIDENLCHKYDFYMGGRMSDSLLG